MRQYNTTKVLRLGRDTSIIYLDKNERIVKVHSTIPTFLPSFEKYNLTMADLLIGIRDSRMMYKLL